MSFTRRLTQDDIRQIDRSDMAGHISAMGSHVREAIGLADSGLANWSLQADAVRSIVVAGMGGSAIGGDLVRCYLAPGLRVPMFVNRSYELPPFVDEHSLVIASSYSGNTEETLAMFEDALRKKAKIVCITTGGKLGKRAKELGLATIGQKPGLQPRAALGYSFVPILLILDRLGLGSGQGGEAGNLELVATMLDTLAERYGPQHLIEDNPAFSLASQLMHRIPVIYSATDFEAVCLRWRGQIQENAKHVAFGNVLPEVTHNEIEGWAHPIDMIEHFYAIILRSPEDEHPRVSKRFEVLKELIGTKQVPVIELRAEGATRLERMMSLISLADWTSYYTALFAGVDPTPIPAMETLKQRMA